MSVAYYDQGTGWTATDDTSIDEALDHLVEDGRVEITTYYKTGNVRLAIGTCAGEDFVLVEVGPGN